MQLRDFGRMASGNSRILVSLRFRVVKLTKALKPEKSAQKRVQVSAQASDIRIFALTASAVSASSWRFRDAGRVHEPSISSHPPKSSVTRAVHLASGSSDPGRSSGQRGQRYQ